MTEKKISIRNFRTEDLDWVIDRHAALYDEEHGFDHTFRGYVEGPVRRFGETMNPKDEHLWIAQVHGWPVGMIAIVRGDGTSAQLRWYLVEPDMRGLGIGKELMKTAIRFCKKNGYRRIFLWTVSQLDVARHLYQAYGFEVTQTEEHSIWGKNQTEERWDLHL